MMAANLNYRLCHIRMIEQIGANDYTLHTHKPQNVGYFMVHSAIHASFYSWKLTDELTNCIKMRLGK